MNPQSIPHSLHLSFDQDWAPPWATLDIHQALQGQGLEGTLFVTHACPCLPALRQASGAGLTELAWHPNYLPGSSHGASTEEVLDTMASLIPEARGVRAHFLVRSTALWGHYAGRGLRYEASDLMDGMVGLRPLRAWNDLVRLPIFWEDDVHAAHGRPFALDSLGLDQPGLKIFDFHPVHLALNTASLDNYQALKERLAQQGTPLTQATREDFEACRNRDTPGAHDLFLALLDHMAAHPEVRGGPLRTLAP